MQRKSLLLALALLGASGSAAAALEDGLYFGGKAGLMMPDASALDDAINIGGNVGYTFPGIILPFNGRLSAEGELTTTISKGDAPGGEWDVTTLGAYGVYRAGDAIYFKGKAGLAYQKFDVRTFGGSGGDTSTDLSVGLGGGLKMGAGALEVEYTLLDDVDFFSVGYLFGF